MDSSVHEEGLFHLHLLWEEKTEESNKEQVFLLCFSSQLLLCLF